MAERLKTYDDDERQSKQENPSSPKREPHQRNKSMKRIEQKLRSDRPQMAGATSPPPRTDEAEACHQLTRVPDLAQALFNALPAVESTDTDEAKHEAEQLKLHVANVLAEAVESAQEEVLFEDGGGSGFRYRKWDDRFDHTGRLVGEDGYPPPTQVIHVITFDPEEALYDDLAEAYAVKDGFHVNERLEQFGIDLTDYLYSNSLVLGDDAYKSNSRDEMRRHEFKTASAAYFSTLRNTLLGKQAFRSDSRGADTCEA